MQVARGKVTHHVSAASRYRRQGRAPASTAAQSRARVAPRRSRTGLAGRVRGKDPRRSRSPHRAAACGEVCSIGQPPIFEAPLHPGGVPHLPDAVAREAYSHEVSSAGFWPGGGPIDYAAFYSYAYPAPDGFATASVRPVQAFFSRELGEFILPYDVVRTAREPEHTLMEFLQSTYLAAAELGRWDRANLECPLGEENSSSPLSRNSVRHSNVAHVAAGPYCVDVANGPGAASAASVAAATSSA